MGVTSNKKIFGGTWWRFDRYEVKDGYIRHILGSPLRSYEPWNEYHTLHGKESTRQPYHSLLDLVSSIDRGELDPNDRDLAIAEWCGQHGLLGVLLLTTTAVTGSVSEVRRIANERLVGISYTGSAGFATPAEVPSDEHPIGLYQPNYGVWAVSHSSPHLADVSERNFFAQLKDQSKCQLPPPPCGEQFWLEYEEPIETFLAAGRFLREVVEQLQGTRDSKKRLVQKQAEFSEKTKLLIEPLVSTVKPIMYLETKGHFGLGWDCGSLWSTFAMMVVLDFTNHRPLICCNSKCGAFFVSKSTEARYCSKKCRDAVHIRKYRNRKRRRKV